METLYSIARVEEAKLKSLLRDVVGKEMSELSKPCYIPSHKAYYYELLQSCGLNEQNIKEFVSRFWKGRKEAKWNLWKDPVTLFSIWLMWYFLKNKDMINFKYALMYHMIRNYANIMKKFMPAYCNEAAFKFTLDHLGKTHLFSREKTIANALLFLANALEQKYARDILAQDLDRISRFIGETRHRINQSVRSFAIAYHNNVKEKIGYKTPYEQPEERAETILPAIEKRELFINEVARRITTFGEIDEENLENARKITSTTRTLAEAIVNELSTPKYSESVRVILDLFLREIKSVADLCGTHFYKIVRSLMAIKRTSKLLHFKQQVTNLLLQILRSIGFERKFKSFTSQTQFLTNLFLAYYITLFARKARC